MEKETFERYLRERYQDQVNWYDAKAISNQGSSRGWEIALICTSALTPVVLVSHFLAPDWRLATLAVISAMANLLITGMMQTFQFEEHWHNYRSTCEELRAEIHLYNAGALDYRHAPDKEALFVQRVEGILAHERRAWGEIARGREPITPAH